MNAMMREVTHSDFTEFLKEHKEAIVKSSRINMGRQKKIGNYQPEQFELERTNAWSFPERGRWATHQGNYRGNWPPQMARNVIPTRPASDARASSKQAYIASVSVRQILVTIVQSICLCSFSTLVSILTRCYLRVLR